MKKKILVIYTGGTIGMVHSEFGYVPSGDGFDSLLRSFPDLSLPEMPELEVLTYETLLDSCNISVNEWNYMAGSIADNYGKYDGFVVLHGTDTMAYSASALSFMLENLSKPVIFTGAQIPMCEVRSDGWSNIVNSVLIAAQGRVNEVCIYFGGKLLRGNRSTKQNSEMFAAFDSPNVPPLANVGISINYLAEAELLPPANGEFRLQRFSDIPVGLIKLFPGIQYELFESIMTEALKGIVLESFGAGNIPNSSSSVLPIVEKAHRNGSVIVVCSQCVQGTVTLGTYATSRALKDVGAVNGGDMTTEAAMTKLMYLFSKGYSHEEIKRLMVSNLRGEITARE